MRQILLIAALLAALSTVARADDTADAKRLFISGTKHFDLNEFADALKDFKEAYRLHDDPVLLYNIAQCYRRLEQNQEALNFYNSYLRRSPKAPNRREVEEKIKALAEASAMQHRAVHVPSDRVEPPAPDPTPVVTAVTIPSPPSSPTPLYKKWWLWTAVGAVVVVGVAVGVGVGLATKPLAGSTFPGVSF